MAKSLKILYQLQKLFYIDLTAWLWMENGEICRMLSRRLLENAKWKPVTGFAAQIRSTYIPNTSLKHRNISLN
jgi:hypothetical protein